MLCWNQDDSWTGRRCTTCSAPVPDDVIAADLIGGGAALHCRECELLNVQERQAK